MVVRTKMKAWKWFRSQLIAKQRLIRTRRVRDYVECPVVWLPTARKKAPAFLIAVSKLLISVVVLWLLEKLKTLARLPLRTHATLL